MTTSVTQATYGLSVRLAVTPAAATEAAIAALKEEGFGVLTTIDVQATLKAKLDVDVAPYVILGACNPGLAHRALGLEPAIGLLLPCNVVVRAVDGGSEVLITDPLAMLKMADNSAVAEVATEARARLDRVAAALAG